MIQSTAKGFKVAFNPVDMVEKVQEPFNFVDTMHNEGIWFAITGKHFGEWAATTAQDFAHFLIDNSDLLLIPGLGLIIFAMAGSKRAGKGLYWLIISYLILKMAGVMI